MFLVVKGGILGRAGSLRSSQFSEEDMSTRKYSCGTFGRMQGFFPSADKICRGFPGKHRDYRSMSSGHGEVILYAAKNEMFVTPLPAIKRLNCDRAKYQDRLWEVSRIESLHPGDFEHAGCVPPSTHRSDAGVRRQA